MLTNYLRVILRFWWLVLLPLLVVVVITIRGYRPPQQGYQVTQRFATGLPPERTSAVYNYDRQYTWLSSEYMAAGFDNVIHTGLFAQNVANRLSAGGVILQPGQIQGALASDHKQSLLIVYLTWPDSEQSIQISQAVSTELTEHGASYWPQLTMPGAAPVIALDQPVPVAISISLRDRFDIPVRVVLAVAAGIALAFIAHFLDPFVRDRQELERLGFNVLGEIPHQKS
jgi:capsular polysaccharide biosynthesis protein